MELFVFIFMCIWVAGSVFATIFTVIEADNKFCILFGIIPFCLSPVWMVIFRHLHFIS